MIQTTSCCRRCGHVIDCTCRVYVFVYVFVSTRAYTNANFDWVEPELSAKVKAWLAAIAYQRALMPRRPPRVAVPAVRAPSRLPWAASVRAFSAGRSS